MLGWLGTAVYVSSDPAHAVFLNNRLDAWLRLLQVFGWIGLVGTVLALWSACRSWADRTRWLWTKIHDTLIALACLVFAWLLVFCNCLNLSLKY
jgi:hypothetical protein